MDMNSYMLDLEEFKRPCSQFDYSMGGASSCLESGVFRPLKRYVPNESGGNCGTRRACYCELISSSHLLPLSCKPTVDITNFQSCYFSEDQGHLPIKVPQAVLLVALLSNTTRL